LLGRPRRVPLLTWWCPGLDDLARGSTGAGRRDRLRRLRRSTRYPGGLALRFARVVRYRDDKLGAEADTIETVRSLMKPASG
jgi:hypothetical protein